MHLAALPPGQTARSQEIAQRQDIAAANNIPKKFLDTTTLENMRTHSGAAARELMYHI